MIDRIRTAFEVGASLAADLVLKFAERNMSPEERQELVEYAADIANRLISQVAGKPTGDVLEAKEPHRPMIPPVFIGPIRQGQPRPTRCEPCHAVYHHFGFNGRCRNIRTGMVAHLTNLDYHFGEALCTLRQQLLRDLNQHQETPTP